MIIPEYCYENGLLFNHDSLVLLKNIKDNCIDLVFADPPYNLKKAKWDKFASPEEYIQWSKEWIAEAARVLKPSGSLFVCGFSEILADLKRPAMEYFNYCKWLVWFYKNKANLGQDWGRSHESALHLRKSKEFRLNIDDIRIPYGQHTLKYPAHPQAQSSQYNQGQAPVEPWSPHPLGAKPKDVLEIPTLCNGMVEKTSHPTQKPEELLRKIVLSSTKIGDIVMDPFSGSGSALVASEQLGRKWIGCDINAEYNSWAINRLNQISHRSIKEWIEFDFNTLKNRRL
ncbi:MAG: site-specific DNA-methyltransferase [Deltaproteobacteria bacterium]|nr:site-specific DNA-methyltransferase [Deltaproteobacteria bacterium]